MEYYCTILTTLVKKAIIGSARNERIGGAYHDSIDVATNYLNETYDNPDNFDPYNEDYNKLIAPDSCGTFPCTEEVFLNIYNTGYSNFEYNEETGIIE